MSGFEVNGTMVSGPPADQRVLVVYVASPIGRAVLAEAMARIGLTVKAEKHGDGPTHWSAVGGDQSLVIEVYPASEAHPEGTWVMR